jgi:hypothetical protein
VASTQAYIFDISQTQAEPLPEPPQPTLLQGQAPGVVGPAGESGPRRGLRTRTWAAITSALAGAGDVGAVLVCVRMNLTGCGFGCGHG